MSAPEERAPIELTWDSDEPGSALLRPPPGFPRGGSERTHATGQLWQAYVRTTGGVPDHRGFVQFLTSQGWAILKPERPHVIRLPAGGDLAAGDEAMGSEAATLRFYAAGPVGAVHMKRQPTAGGWHVEFELGAAPGSMTLRALVAAAGAYAPGDSEFGLLRGLRVGGVDATSLEQIVPPETTVRWLAIGHDVTIIWRERPARTIRSTP